MYRETMEVPLSLGMYYHLAEADAELASSIELLVIIDGQKQEEDDNETVVVAKRLLGIHPEDPARSFYGMCRIWTGNMPNGVHYGLYLKGSGMARGKRMSHVFLFDLISQRHKEFNIDPTYLITHDCDTTVQPKVLKNMVAYMDSHEDLVAIGQDLQALNYKSSMLRLAGEFEQRWGSLMMRLMLMCFGRTDVIAGPFAMFRWTQLKEIYPEYSKVVDISSLVSINKHLGEDCWLTWLALRKNKKLLQTRFPAEWVLAVGKSEIFGQKRRWINNNTVIFFDTLMSPGKLVDTREGILFMIVCLLRQISCWIGPSVIAVCVLDVIPYLVTETPEMWCQRFLAFSGVLCLIFAYRVAGVPASKCKHTIEAAVWFSWILSIVLYAILIVALKSAVFAESWHHLPIVIGPMVLLTIAYMLVTPIRDFPLMFCSFFAYVNCQIVFLVLIPIYSLVNLDLTSWGTRELQTDINRSSQHKRTKSIEAYEDMWRGQSPNYLSDVIFAANQPTCKLTAQEFQHQVRHVRFWKWIICMVTLVLNVGIITASVTLGDLGFSVLPGVPSVLAMLLLSISGFTYSMVGMAAIGYFRYLRGTDSDSGNTRSGNGYWPPKDFTQATGEDWRLPSKWQYILKEGPPCGTPPPDLY
jgi:cellulose synthase/poly-beta-1,6-N-acetylglucosamine synthase-like glycosyltransferase